MISWLDLLAKEGERATRLRTDLPYFAEHCLKLRPKTGSLAPFVFNPAQLKVHRKIEEQKARTGKVRVIILKARQLGISTYLSARFFHRCLFEPGLRTFILGHERRASTNLFEMVKRMYEHLPEDVRPATGTFNAETLLFNNDSGYIVSVATLDGAGRSATAQLLHASEAAFWPDLEAQAASLFQVVPDTHSLDDEQIACQECGIMTPAQKGGVNKQCTLLQSSQWRAYREPVRIRCEPVKSRP